ncbi:hypothetical protein [Streptomyces luteireticuli]|uniref:hypothetical protein n=1 Tax=Streptomyces luteireticuli TaxID=173858 RepID=UPI0031D6CFCF
MQPSPSTSRSIVSEAPQKAQADPKRPEPDAGQTKTLIADLGAINPGLAQKEDRAVRRSVNTCSDIKAGLPAEKVQHNARLRFSGGTAGSLTDEQARKIVEAVKGSFCH